MLDPVIQYCLLGSFALLFALSAAEKLNDRDAFIAQIVNYRVLPDAMAPLLARLIPLTEMVTATLLITAAYKYGVLMGLAMLAAYAIGIWLNLLRGRTHIDCGCLGSQGEGISYLHVVRNIFLIGLLSLCLLPVGFRELIWLDYIVIVLYVGTSMLIYASLTQLLASHLNQRLWWD